MLNCEKSALALTASELLFVILMLAVALLPFEEMVRVPLCFFVLVSVVII